MTGILLPKLREFAPEYISDIQIPTSPKEYYKQVEVEGVETIKRVDYNVYLITKLCTKNYKRVHNYFRNKSFKIWFESEQKNYPFPLVIFDNESTYGRGTFLHEIFFSDFVKWVNYHRPTHWSLTQYHTNQQYLDNYHSDFDWSA